ncbi:MAG: cation diffusion facilitator family transporter [Chloroflexi bacterium]|nr:cation diffusion facilitator family transporter [Chloroflexota bacterium]
MDHSHQHTDLHSKNLRLVLFLNVAFTLQEIVGGIWTNSLAILSDALHDLGDSFSLSLAWYLERYSQRSEDNIFTYGYRRFSLLGALISTIVLLVGSLFILSEAVPRLLNPQHSNAQGMALMAIVGILVNGATVFGLRRDEGMNSRVVALHLLEDVLGWLAVLVVSIVLIFTDIHILDPLLSILLTIHILFNVFRNLGKTLQLFLQAAPEQLDLNELSLQIESIPGVQSTHHLHAWSLEGETTCSLCTSWWMNMPSAAR